MAKKSESGTAELALVSKQLRDAAEKLGLSQNQVARLSGISRKHVGVAFSGGNISLGILAKLIPVLKIESLTFGNAVLKSAQPFVDSRLVAHALKLLARAVADAQNAHALLSKRR
jgi:transcriptional regulator with XRE-family HTH domain